MKGIVSKLPKIVKEIQGASVLAQKALGMTHLEIAKAMGISEGYVAKIAKEAVNHPEWVQRAREITDTKLMPLAISIYEDELKRGNFDAATNVLFGRHVLERGARVTVQGAPGGAFAAWRDEVLSGGPNEEAG